MFDLASATYLLPQSLTKLEIENKKLAEIVLLHQQIDKINTQKNTLFERTVKNLRRKEITSDNSIFPQQNMSYNLFCGK
jgi:hypothetical protein